MDFKEKMYAWTTHKDFIPETQSRFSNDGGQK